MTAKSVLIFPNRHMHFSIGDLEKSESGKAGADFVPNWSFVTPSNILSFRAKLTDNRFEAVSVNGSHGTCGEL